jgi:ribosomal protein L40E
MSLSDKLKVLKMSIEEGTDVAVKKSQTFIEYSDLSLTVASLKKKTSEIYAELGEKIYKEFKDGEPKALNVKMIWEYCEEIKGLEKEICKLKKKMLKLTNKKECKKCGALIDKKAQFCHKCGYEAEN